MARPNCRVARAWVALLWFYLGFCCCFHSRVGQPERFCLSPTFPLLLRVVNTCTYLCHLWAVAQQWQDNGGAGTYADQDARFGPFLEVLTNTSRRRKSSMR